MNKTKSAVLYECSTKIKAICFFYLIQYAAVSLINLIIGISMGTFENVGTNILEINSFIFVGIFGVLGFKEDFKMLIQNGFTRKYIFLSTACFFAFMAGVMALVDTIVGQSLHYLASNYESLFGSLYGYENVFANWIWLTILYMLILSLFYLGILVINKVGKMVSIYLGVILGGIILLIVALFRFILSAELLSNIIEFIMKAMGFMTDGTINYFFPVVTLLLLVSVLGSGSYIIIRRTELK